MQSKSFFEQCGPYCMIGVSEKEASLKLQISVCCCQLDQILTGTYALFILALKDLKKILPGIH